VAEAGPRGAARGKIDRLRTALEQPGLAPEIHRPKLWQGHLSRLRPIRSDDDRNGLGAPGASDERRRQSEPQQQRASRAPLANVGYPLSRTMIIEKVWGHDFGGFSNVIDVHIDHLRRKIDRDFETKLIHTVKGVGYVLENRSKSGSDPEWPALRHSFRIGQGAHAHEEAFMQSRGHPATWGRTSSVKSSKVFSLSGDNSR
jgi:hypothetical protein